MSEKSKKFSFLSTTGKKFGCFTVLIALLLPVIFWTILLIMDATRNYCSECSVGWTAVGTSFLAIPVSAVGLLIWAISNSRENSGKKE
jgi:hypothetical protein